MTETTKGTEAYAPKAPRPDRKRWWVRTEAGKWHYAEHSLQNGRPEAAQSRAAAAKGQPCNP